MSTERNLLIEAGAGTGKTTRLVKAVLQALFIRQIPLESVVALTFTNKAAGELKERVGSALEDILSAKTIDALKARPWWPTPAPQLPLTDLQKLATEARAVLDRANISTIHSFAFSLLKRFPLAAGIDPKAEIDDKGLRFDELFRREWPIWLATELSEKPPREALWTELLSKITLSEVEEAVRMLSDFEVPLEHLIVSDQDLSQRLKEHHAGIRELIAAHGGKLKADEIAAACEEVIGKVINAKQAEQGVQAQRKVKSAVCPLHSVTFPCSSCVDLAVILKQSPGNPKAWSAEDIARLKQYKAISLNILVGGDRIVALLTQTLAPFVAHFRQVLLTEGCLTHSALLFLSREIVKNHPDIRTALKRTVKLILIDEFQDTDPLQAELLLYLAEKEGHEAKEWDQVKLEAGKLFIVGDPKQSIYRFRGADIAAYERIGKLLVAQGGSQETLETNYRSQSQVISLVNMAFNKIILPEPEISPPYIAVQPHHPHDPKHAVQDVELWLADSPEEQSVDDAQATEADAAAQWIKDSVGKLTIFDSREGARRPMLYRDVALIFRTYSPMDRFIEALRRHGIPFAVESERYFFTTPEVTDFVNLLRAAADPEDLLSLVGYLRSPMGGLTDQEILIRRNAGTLEKADTVRWLRTITARLGRQPLAEVLKYIFDTTYLLELAVRSYHGDQTVANLLKLRRLLEAFAAEGVTTMGLLLKKLEEFFNDDKIEGESPLADENYNAVRLLTIHKAKGLEYPVVFLPSLHSSLVSRPAESFIYDWRSRKMGLQVGAYCNLDKLLLDEQTRRREAAEENRILYVAMTRARERLVLSGGVHLKAHKRNTYLHRLLGAWGLELEELQTARVNLGDTSISVRRLERIKVTTDKKSITETVALPRVDAEKFAAVWRTRAQIRMKMQETALVTTPTTVERGTWYEKREENEYDNASDSRITYHVSRDFSTRLGILLHRFLEHWDFSCEKCSMPAILTRLANTYFAQEGMLRRALPDPKEGKLKLEKDDPMTDIVAIVDEAQRLLADFIGSEAEEEIKGAKILGREVPFFYGTNPLMRGAMDIVYRLPDGQLVIGDYKTGQTKQDYAAQEQAYQEAVKRALGEEAVFKIIALR
jgi:ATP-dependent helicase/nuclease subunit A